jgi:hypothetical protein
LVLAGKLASAAVRSSHFLGITADLAETPGPLDIAGVAAAQTLWSYLFDHQEFMRGLHRILISFRPLVLIIAGSLALPNGFRGKAKEFQKKRPTCRSHCSSFDVKAEAGFARLPPDGVASLQF